ncbi:MAG: tetratricopeptide repeat protein [Pseudomonadota bacterium]
MRFLLVTLVSASLTPGLAGAKPVITSSEETLAQVCLGYDRPTEQLITACRAALDGQDMTVQERADLQSALGYALRDMEEDEQAEDAFRAALELDPTGTRARNGLGWVYYDRQDYDRAVVEFQASVDFRASEDGLGGLGAALWRSDQADGETALTWLEAALAIDPEDGWTLRETGWINLDIGRYPAAHAAFDAALAVRHDDWNAHYGRARVFEMQDDFEAALLALNAAVLADPDVAWIYGKRAYILRLLDRNAQAVTDAERMISMAPAAANGYTQKGLALNELERRAAALESFEAGIAAGAANNFLLYWYADVLSDDAQFDRAAEIIDRAIATGDADASDHSLRAYIAVERRSYPEALEAAETALSMDPEMAYPHYYAAVALVNADKLDAGLERFDQAMRAGLDSYMVGVFAADLLSAGKPFAALALRRKY